jgi:hypothetical protein
MLIVLLAPKHGQSFSLEKSDSMATRKTIVIRLFGFDATDWSILIFGIVLSGFLVAFL